MAVFFTISIIHSFKCLLLFILPIRWIMRRVLLFILFLSGTCFAQDASVFKPDAVKKEVVATRISQSLRVTTGSWRMKQNGSRLAYHPLFIQIEPLQGALPNHLTSTRVLWRT